MKHRIASILTILVLLGCFTLSAFATSARLNYITDMADLLTESQTQQLEEKAAAISERYNFGVYVITVSNFRQYSNASEIHEAAINIYDSYYLGWGSDTAGTMLFLSMDERDYVLDYNSSRADYVFNEVGRDRLEDQVVDQLRSRDYYSAFSTYLSLCERYLRAAEEGHPIAEGESPESDSIGIFAAIPGAIAALLTGTIMSAPMKSAKLKTNADGYTVDGSLNIHRRSDMFLHRTVTRVPRQTQSSSPSRSSTHYSSGSHSGRSGKF